MRNPRPISPAEYPLLADFLYHAIFIPPGTEPAPREVIEKPEIAVYIDGFGSQKGDTGVLSVQENKIVGAAWTRIIPAFGRIDDETPELAISVLPEYRGQGTGTELLKALFEKLSEQGYRQTSLSVQKENPALRLYQRMGYKTVRENDEDYIMVRSLKEEMRGTNDGMCAKAAAVQTSLPVIAAR
ncbi:MAG: GNAT family N-acetyltransferase [Clostridiales Family XIII bacterium]|nr:GNAT family N-acetyltransferase [Clostridiales Family XIII bacterium]